MRRKLGVTCTSCLVALAAASALGIGGLSSLTGKTACSVMGCDKEASQTTKVTASEAGSCSCGATSSAMDARLVKAKAAYESACEGECSVTKAKSETTLIAAKSDVAKRDYMIAKIKFLQAKVNSVEFAYEGACAGECPVTKAKANANLLKTRVAAAESYAKIAKFAECEGCSTKSVAKLNEAKVSLAKFEYAQAAAGTCAKTKAAAKANLEAVCTEAGVCGKSAAASVEKAAAAGTRSKAAQGEPVASR